MAREELLQKVQRKEGIIGALEIPKIEHYYVVCKVLDFSFSVSFLFGGGWIMKFSQTCLIGIKDENIIAMHMCTVAKVRYLVILVNTSPLLNEFPLFPEVGKWL